MGQYLEKKGLQEKERNEENRTEGKRGMKKIEPREREE